MGRTNKVSRGSAKNGASKKMDWGKINDFVFRQYLCVLIGVHEKFVSLLRIISELPRKVVATYKTNEIV